MRHRAYRKPRLTLIFIVTCIIISVIGATFPLMQKTFQELAFVPAYSFQRPWTFVTSIFLHGDVFPIEENGKSYTDFSHLIWNMLALFISGIYLEPRVSTIKFLFIFLFAGILGNVAYLIISFNSIIPAVGASGAIYGMLGLLAALFPTLMIRIGYLFIPVIVIAFILTISSILGLFTISNIGYEAHLAGLLFGILYGFHLRKKVRRQYMY